MPQLDRSVCVALAVWLCLASTLDIRRLEARTQSNRSNPSDQAATIQRGNLVAQQISTQEWLGPLSAIALSPFFGLACLSGAATYGPDWLQERSTLLGSSSPLNNPLLFWSMLVLTVMTSLPRFTKVSKPISLAAEKLEAYSAVIILLMMKFLSGESIGSLPELSTSGVPVFALAGVQNVSWDILLSIAAAINIIVVNTIKLAIEVLVWLIPIPAVDAILEVTNKTLSASLMAVYAYSPTLATIINLIVFAACSLVFFRVKREMRYFYELLLMPVLNRFFALGKAESEPSIGFLTQGWSGFPSKTMFRVVAMDQDPSLVQLTTSRWFREFRYDARILDGLRCEKVICDEIVVRVNDTEVKLHVRKGAAVSLPHPSLNVG